MNDWEKKYRCKVCGMIYKDGVIFKYPIGDGIVYQNIPTMCRKCGARLKRGYSTSDGFRSEELIYCEPVWARRRPFPMPGYDIKTWTE